MPIPLLTNILVPIVAGLCCIYFFMRKSKKGDGLRKSGIRAEGVISDFANNDQGTGHSSGNHSYPVIRFVTQSGEWITGKYNITHSSLRQGDKVTVYYDHSNPSEFYVEMGGAASLLPAILVLGIVAIGYGLYRLVEYLLY